jgi:hypothetical protein
MPEEIKCLMHASLSKSAWAKHTAAVSSFKEFERHASKSFSWPLSSDAVSGYIHWAVSNKKLKHTTVKSYMASLTFVHKLKGLDTKNCTGFIPTRLIQGAANLTFYKELTKGSRKVMTISLLRILGHQIALTSLPVIEKQALWTLYVIAFFGSFRLGELLSPSESSFIPAETLLWKDVIFKESSVVLKIKIPKSRILSGEVVDLFRVERGNLCPVLSLIRLKKLATNTKPDCPVFSYNSGILLTPAKVNDSLKSLLTPILGEGHGGITGHSFRAGIPSALANRPDIANEQDIMSWGRWSSSSYKLYTRLGAVQKRTIFTKIMSALE